MDIDQIMCDTTVNKEPLTIPSLSKKQIGKGLTVKSMLKCSDCRV